MNSVEDVVGIWDLGTGLTGEYEKDTQNGCEVKDWIRSHIASAMVDSHGIGKNIFRECSVKASQ